MQKKHFKNSTPVHDKNSQQASNRQKLPRLYEEYLQKNLQLASYIMVRN